MTILPVIDVMKGRVVRAIAGRRSEYRPLVSVLTDSTDPLTVARAIRDRFGLSQLYVADLDAIMGGPWASDLYRTLARDGFHLWVDAGVQVHTAAGLLLAHGVRQVVVGLETVIGPEEWRALVAAVGAARLTFSLDLRDGRPIGPLEHWGSNDPRHIADQVIRDGARRVIVLDLARIGLTVGTGSDDVCRDLADRFPNVEVFVGGGVRDAADLRRLKGLGASGALVASAIHEGRMTPEEVANL